MIDINSVKHKLDNYIGNYDINDPQIRIKKEHINRVSSLSEKLARKLNLSDEDILLAQLIGLLHDIGRFEQIKRYHTFIDKNSVDHGLLGVKILFEDGLIRDLIDTNKYDSIIKKAILNHNKDQIDSNMSDIEYLHSQIIRDADKTDILYLSSLDNDDFAMFETDNLEKEIISYSVYKDLINNYKIDYNNINSKADIVLCHFAYVFDYNFVEMIEFIEHERYIDKLYNRISFDDYNSKEMFDKSYRLVKSYMNYRKNDID